MSGHTTKHPRPHHGTARLTERGCHLLGPPAGTVVVWRSGPDCFDEKVADDIYTEGGTLIGNSLSWSEGDDVDPGLFDVVVAR